MYKVYKKTASGGWYDIILVCQHESEATQLVERLVGANFHTFVQGESTQYYAHYNLDSSADFIIVKE